MRAAARGVEARSFIEQVGTKRRSRSATRASTILAFSISDQRRHLVERVPERRCLRLGRLRSERRQIEGLDLQLILHAPREQLPEVVDLLRL